MASPFRARLWAALSLVLAAVSTPAGAVTLQCFEREALLARLKEATGETPRQAGLAANGAMLEVTVNDDGQWTAYFTYPDGYTCPFASGEGWRSLPGSDDEPEA